jgi:hypothetical protein
MKKGRTSPLQGATLNLLIMTCLFAPYGTFRAGGGSLRIDHLVVYLTALLTLAFVRPMVKIPILGAVHAIIVFWSLFSTIANLDVAAPHGLDALKSLDNLVRANIVLWTSASLAQGERVRVSVLKALTWASVILLAMALVDRLAADSAIGQWLSFAYGGPAYPNLRVNHKQLMNIAGRASASFVTAPSLGMASVMLMLVGLLGGRSIPVLRWLMIACAAAAGLLSNSKSFVLGVPLMLILLSGRQLLRWTAIAVVGVLWTVVIIVANQLPMSVNPLTDVVSMSDPLWLLTSGRFSDDGSILWVSERVLEDAPFTGYGLGVRSDLYYADSAINRYMLYAGAPGFC